MTEATKTTNQTAAADLNEQQLDQMVGAGGMMIERRATADSSDVIVHDIRKQGGDQQTF